MTNPHKPKKDLTTGSVRKHIMLLAAPMLVAMFSHNLLTLVDTFFVGRLGAEAIAAVAASFPIFFIIIALNSGMGIGVSSAVARSIGKKDFEKTTVIAENGLLIAVALSLLMVAGFFTIEPVISFMGVADPIASLMKGYISILYLGSAVFFFGNVASAMLQGEGDAKTPMKAMVISNLLNIALDPVLIFGPGPIPAMGVNGAAIATVISVTFGALYTYSHLFGDKAIVKLTFKKLAYSSKAIRDILVISIPTAASQGSIAVGIFFLNKLVASFGSTALAGFGIAIRAEAIAILPAFAIGFAALAVIGQNIGARQYERARHASLVATVAAFAFMEAVGIILLLTSPLWLSAFTQSAEVISYGRHYFSIAAMAYGFIGLRIIAASSFQGLGKALPVFGVTTLNFGLMIALAYILAFKAGTGISGIWWGILIADIIAGVAAQLWFQNTLRHAERLHMENTAKTTAAIV